MFRIAPPDLPFDDLQRDLTGELYFDASSTHTAMRRLFSTDASVYQEMPLAVAVPRTVEDIRRLVQFARQHRTSLIPRAAGTSLAGQVVGGGIVVDISNHFTQILELNVAERWVRVQPGVIRDDLNAYLRPFGLMFGPETSTASRAMVGGMIGNNSCGLHSIVWGTTRDHLKSVRALLSDGSEVVFGPLSAAEFRAKCEGRNVSGPLEQQLYQHIDATLGQTENRRLIRDTFPKPTVTRRNTGYALDELLPFFDGQEPFNFCNLIAGSEGTLCFVTEATLNLLPLPPAEGALVCVHTETIRQTLEANLVALEHQCYASEVVDDYILQLTKTNIEQTRNREFVEGSPKAILMVEFFEETREEVRQKAERLIADLQQRGLGYAYPVLYGEEAKKAWNLRKAGLGIMYNIPGDDKPVNLIEDCAVDVRDLPDYIDELEQMAAERYGLSLEYSAHAGAGELHVLVLMNLKTSEGRRQFRALLADTAALVKKYGGSLSGEHGDGRLRGEFIPFMIGEEAFRLVKDIKRAWDPQGLFNPGKIVDTPPMNESMRYEADKVVPQPKTTFDFSDEGGLLNLAEKCNGSGDCRKTHISGGTMCPSYMATRNEKETTRARANLLRHFYTREGEPQKHDYEEVKDVLDLCLSCKGCKAECPSSVDMARMKAEFLQQQYDAHGTPLRSRLVGNFTKLMSLASLAPWAYNALYNTPALRKIANRAVGFHPERTMPHLAGETLRKWFKHRRLTFDAGQLTKKNQASGVKRQASKIYLFCDEFTNYNDVEVGQKAILLLEALGYEVVIPEHVESGRTYLSKGLVREAQTIAERNVRALKGLISAETPLIGIEPSAILSFRDEYPDLVPAPLKDEAKILGQHALLLDEFIAREIDAKRISRAGFTTEKRLIKLHGHCHQKALSSLVATKKMLSLPPNYEVQLIPSGCCGMAGSFGYEAEHYELSMQVGELVLFPTVRQQPQEVIIAAPGTSCRHQIKDGTGRVARHPAEVLYEAIKGMNN